MALLPINLYSDWKCTQAGQAIVPGVAAATGNIADPTRWHVVSWRNAQYSKGNILVLSGIDVATIGGEFTLSRGAAIYDCSVPQTIPYSDTVDKDKINQDSSNYVYNPFFISHDEENDISYALSIYSTPENATYKYFTLLLYVYTQSPEDANGSSRQTWSYYYDFNNLGWLGENLYLYNQSAYWDTNMRQIKLYKLALGDQEYYLFAFGVTADGQYNTTNQTTTGTKFIAIPLEYFKDKEARPWVGEESEPDEETGFMPNDEPSDNITARTDFNINPYSINSGGSGIKVIFPEYVEGSYYTLMGDIISGIYQGSNEGFINRVEQVWAELVNGNTNRAAEEIQAIQNGILFYHSIPVITTYSTSYHSFRTICGYNVINSAKSVAQASGSIFSRTYRSDVINPRLNCFLDYDPYTSMIIKVPFCPAVSVSPSAVYGKEIKAVYKIDIVTGILHCDISIYSASHEYIIHSCEANVKTDIPIMGQGANAGGLEKITGAVLGAMSGNVGAGVSGIVGTLDAVAGKSHGEAVGKMSTDGIGAYLAARSAYLIVTYPKAAIPTQEEDGAPVGGFLWQQGMASATAEKISYYSGGFAKFSSVDLSRVQATQAEKEDIIARLKEGVYL